MCELNSFKFIYHKNIDLNMSKCVMCHDNLHLGPVSWDIFADKKILLFLMLQIDSFSL